MDIAFEDVRCMYSMAYMEGLVIFSRRFDEDIAQREDVHDIMSRTGLTINPKKVQLATSEIHLLGFVVEDAEFLLNGAKLKAITEYPCTRDVKRLQRFLGMIAFYRTFISHCAELARPRNKVGRKGVKWQWRELVQELSRPCERLSLKAQRHGFPI